jgi:hypothetical protein
MPRGFAAIKAAAEKQNSNSFEYPSALLLKLPKDGDSAIVRFLEQGDDVYSYWYHDYSHVDKPNGWKTKVPCLDQDDEGVPCPGCREGWPRKFQGLINLIWRDAPIFKRDDEGKVEKKKNGEFVVEGYEDQVAIWRQGINLFSKTLPRKDVTYKGLGTRDFEITREGETMNDTTYAIEPVVIDGETKAVPLSKADKDLAKDKYDLEEFANFVDADTFEKIIAKRNSELEDGEEDDEEDIKAFLKTSPLKEDEE